MSKTGLKRENSLVCEGIPPWMEKSLGTVWHKIEGFHDENISEKNFVSCGSFQLQDQFVILFRLFF